MLISQKVIKKPFRYFNGFQTGGRIVVNGNNIYLTIGDYNWKLSKQKVFLEK